MLALFVNEDNLVEIDELRKAADDVFVNDATTTFTLKTLADVGVTGAINVAMPYVVASDGKYQGFLLGTVALVINTRYYLEITVNTTEGFRRVAVITKFHPER